MQYKCLPTRLRGGGSPEGEDTMHIHPREWSVMRQESGDRACAATLLGKHRV